MQHSDEITDLLGRARQGDRASEDQLIQILYAELRRIAASCLRSERRQLTIQPTALVHEAYMRLRGNRTTEWGNRQHFLGTAAHVMRRVLVDHARNRTCTKRGGRLCRVELDDNQADSTRTDWIQEVLDLDIALTRLAELD